MDYSKLSEITVKTQRELDQIPKDFTGTVYIEFGTAFSPAIIRNRFGSVSYTHLRAHETD